MATNNKHLDSVKYQKALSLDDRLSIDKIISSNRESSGALSLTLNSISDILEKNPTTISKEVKKLGLKLIYQYQISSILYFIVNHVLMF